MRLKKNRPQEDCNGRAGPKGILRQLSQHWALAICAVLPNLSSIHSYIVQLPNKLKLEKQLGFESASSDPRPYELLRHRFCHITWKSGTICCISILTSNILSEILSSIYSDILSGILFGISSDIQSGINSGRSGACHRGRTVRARACPGWQSFWHKPWHSIWHLFWHSIPVYFSILLWQIFSQSFWWSIWVYLASIVTFHLAGIYSDILFALFQVFCLHSIWYLFWHSTWHLSWSLSGI